MWAQPNSSRHARQRRLQTPHVPPLQAVVTQQHPLWVARAPAHLAGVVCSHRRQGRVDDKVNVGVVAGGAVLQVFLEQRPAAPCKTIRPLAPTWCTCMPPLTLRRRCCRRVVVAGTSGPPPGTSVPVAGSPPSARARTAVGPVAAPPAGFLAPEASFSSAHRPAARTP
jgi:hypothetical protein